MSQGKRERGSILVVVLLALLVVSTIGAAMIYMSQGDHRAAANEADSERAMLAAKAGMNYAYQQFVEGAVTPTVAGAPFDSMTAGVSGPLKGASFSGSIFDDSATAGKGQLYRIVATGTSNRANRTAEIVFQIVPLAFRFGYAAFNEADLHNHSGLAGPSFKIESTIFSNGDVKIPDEITIDGSVVAADGVQSGQNSVLKGDVFANALSLATGSSVEGNVQLLTAVEDLPPAAATWDRVDNYGNKYAWYSGNSTPGSVSGSGTIGGTTSSYAIQNNDLFRTNLFRRDGKLLSSPEVNVVGFVPPPKVAYDAMKVEADLNDATYFTTMTDAMTYLAANKVTEVIDGKTLITIKVGTPTNPEFLYVADDFTLELDPSLASDSPGSGKLKADGFHLEGGIFTSGDFSFNGPMYDPALHPPPPDYYQLKLNALAYCMPAIVNYPEPSTGTVATWTADDTPAMSGGSKLTIKSNVSPHEGFIYIHGAVYSEGEIHLHHTKSSDELIRFIGAELAYKVHNCDYFWFSYDPDVVCTRFLVSEEGTPEVVSFREIR